MASVDEGGEQSAEGLLPGEQLPEDLPESFSIGTKRAYAQGYEYPYKKTKIGEETFYVCKKGSDAAQKGEALVLRRDADGWTAYDSSVTGSDLTCRQKVFRSDDPYIYKEGEHVWQMNKSVSTTDNVDEPEWFGSLWRRTTMAKN